jgi:hypothetical protein
MVMMAGSPVNVWPSAKNDAFRFGMTPLFAAKSSLQAEIYTSGRIGSSSSVRRKKEFLRNGIIGVCPAKAIQLACQTYPG